MGDGSGGTDGIAFLSAMWGDLSRTINEVDSQLTQAMEGYMDVAGQPAAA
jgi:hypothetical protein